MAGVALYLNSGIRICTGGHRGLEYEILRFGQQGTRSRWKGEGRGTGDENSVWGGAVEKESG